MYRAQRLAFSAYRAFAAQQNAAQQATSAPAFAHLFSSASASSRAASSTLPAGHVHSDLSDTACNIGLNRRRDLTLRADLSLHLDGQKLTLAQIFKGKKVLLVGFPGGSVCEKQHLPAYLEAAGALANQGVDQVVAVSVGEPAAIASWSNQAGLRSGRFAVYADGNGGFVRLLGLDLPQAPKCQRFAGIVDDGILLRLFVENNPAELKVTDVDSMMKVWRHVYD